MCARYRSYSRSGRRDYSRYPEYVPVAEKRARNMAASAKMFKNGENPEPVIVQGRKIAASWWGVCWNENLERYADYSNRIGRGRSYVCHGAVLDLKIDPGLVKALVQGSRAKPYQVTITIAKLDAKTWDALRTAALTSLSSLPDLLAGRFPQDLKDIFFASGTGLFPTPKEITLECSCPDWATMCKHVAAVLYGIGNRLDKAPELLFTLRGVTVEELIRKTVETTSRSLLDKAVMADGDGILNDADIGEVFGIEMGDVDIPMTALPPIDGGKNAKSVVAKAPAVPKVARSAKKATAARSAKKATAARSAKGTTGKPSTSAGKSPTPGKRAARPTRKASKASLPEHGGMLDALLAAAPPRRSFATSDLAAKLPAWSRQQISNTLQRAIAQALLVRVSRGKYRRSNGG